MVFRSLNWQRSKAEALLCKTYKLITKKLKMMDKNNSQFLKFLLEMEARTCNTSLVNLNEERKKKIAVCFFSLRIHEQSEGFPFSFLNKDDQYLNCSFSINEKEPVFFYPDGPVTDSLTIHSFTAKKIVNYFIPKENESNFLFDFKELLKAHPEELNLKTTETLVIEIAGGFTIENLNSKFFPTSKKLYFNFVKPEDIFDDEREYPGWRKKEFSQFIVGNDYNRDLGFINLLQLQFYANHNKIKKSFPPHIKRVIICRIFFHTLTEEDEIKGIEPRWDEFILYDSDKSLEEIFVEHDWLFKGAPYKLS